MKDLGPRYDPQVAKILGFDPNPNSSSYTRPTFETREATSDVALEFSRRMMGELGDIEGMAFWLNAPQLFTTRLQGNIATRTYYKCLFERSARSQVFTKAQEMKFKKNPRTGNFSLTHIFMNSQSKSHPWSEIDIEFPEDAPVVIRAKNSLASLSLQVEYHSDTDEPRVYMNGSADPLTEQRILTESDAGFRFFEKYPSSVLVPVRFSRQQLLGHIGMEPGNDISLNPCDAQNIADKTYYQQRDPLKAAKIQWIP